MPQPDFPPLTPNAYSAETQGVRVDVRVDYCPDQSDPDVPRHVWAYTITIENRSAQAVQLHSRHWIITDERGRTEEVKGLGVVGQQPVILPGGSHEYTSGCPLNASSGVMQGRFLMIGADGTRFEAEVPAFSLDLPYTRKTLN